MANKTILNDYRGKKKSSSRGGFFLFILWTDSNNSDMTWFTFYLFIYFECEFWTSWVKDRFLVHEIK